ncbi:MAG: transporter substrate-binding domain-containing protein [Methanobacteriota archaeon]
MMKEVFRGAIILLIAFSCATMVIAIQPDTEDGANNSSPDRLEEILSRGTLVVALNPDDYPLANISSSYRNPDSKCTEDQYTEDQVSGFQVDVATGIAQKLGVDSCYVVPDREELERGNWSEKWDYYPNYLITDERLNWLYFTQPIVSVPYVLYIRNNSATITSHEDLSRKIIGATYALPVLSGYLNNTLNLSGNTHENLVKNATVVGYDEESLAFDDLASGKVDALLLVDTEGDEAINNGTPITPLMPYAAIGYGALSIEKGNGADPVSFVRKLTDIIQVMHQEGELSRISMKYDGIDITQDAATFDVASLNQFNE